MHSTYLLEKKNNFNFGRGKIIRIQPRMFPQAIMSGDRRTCCELQASSRGGKIMTIAIFAPVRSALLAISGLLEMVADLIPY